MTLFSQLIFRKLIHLHPLILMSAFVKHTSGIRWTGYKMSSSDVSLWLNQKKMGMKKETFYWNIVIKNEQKKI